VSVPIRPCWICGNPADSREHKFKRSDVAKAGTSWARDDQPYYFDQNGSRRLQGPGSDRVKFEKVICHACNTTRSQPFDRAYDRFAEWVNQKGDALMTATDIDLAEIFGIGFQIETENLIRYFAKHLGCRIASDNYSMPPGLVALMNGGDLSLFGVTLSRNAEIAGAPIRGAGVLHNFPTLGFYSPKIGETHGPFMSGMVVGYLDVIYRYGDSWNYSWEGDPIRPSQQTVRLGAYVRGAPHPTNGLLPGDDGSREIEIGGVVFKIPVLSRDQIQCVLALELPTSEMTVEQNIEARLKIAHTILSFFYPDITEDFLEEHLTLDDTEKLWSCVKPPKPPIKE
jgi:hypothetical protein